MSTGRIEWKELYVGFLLFLLTFLYLSHLNREIAAVELHHSETMKAKRMEFFKPSFTTLKG